MAQLNIVIPDDMKEWLDEHKEINKSALFREAVRKKQDIVKGKVSSTVFFVTVIGIMMSITLIGISTRPFMEPIIRLALAILGGVLAVTISLLYYKEKKELNATREIS